MNEAPDGWQCADCLAGRTAADQQLRAPPRAPVVKARGPIYPLGGRTKLTPVVTALVAVNVACFLASYNGSAFGRDDLIERFLMWPYGVGHLHQWYRLITGTFLHENWIHIGSNMFALVIVGSWLERSIGKIRFLTLYLLAGIGGSVCDYLFNTPQAASLGASGAIFGLFGAAYILSRRRGLDASMITGLIVLNLVLTFADSQIDWRGHIGGLITGSLVGLVFVIAEDWPRAERTKALAVQVSTSVATLAAFAALVQLQPGQFHV
jgi:membrane associated rhomboid family serine protease